MKAKMIVDKLLNLNYFILIVIICFVNVVWADWNRDRWSNRREAFSWYPEYGQAFETDEADMPWDGASLPTENFLSSQIERSMELRARRELGLLQSTLDGQAVPFASFVGQVNLDNSVIPNRARRSGTNPLPAPQNENHSNLHWRPILLGSICTVVGVVVIVGAATYLMRIQSTTKRMKTETPGITSTFYDKGSPPGGSLLGDASLINLDGDRKLAHSAQMYHYQHQKQQMLAVEKANGHAVGSDEGTGSDVDDGDFTVYECPGLAEPNQLELENPLYEGGTDDPTTDAPNIRLHQSQDLDDESDSTPTAKTMDQ